MTKTLFGQKLLVLHKTKARKNNDVDEVYLPKHLQSLIISQNIFLACHQQDATRGTFIQSLP